MNELPTGAVFQAHIGYLEVWITRNWRYVIERKGQEYTILNTRARPQ